MEVFAWLGIAFCISQSAMFSGMNLAVFSISRLRLEAGASSGNKDAVKLLEMRQDANFLLTTILWGNVGINVLLTLLSDSVMTGLLAFLFSTILITFAGEIMPQAYFSRNALRMAALLSPVLRMYQFILFPVAKPVAFVLDRWLGPEGVHYFREKDLREVIKIHIQAEGTDMDKVEGLGALNFLDFDDLSVAQEGEPIDPQSIIQMNFSELGSPAFPEITGGIKDPFVQQIQRSGKKWVVLTDKQAYPRMVLDADGLIRQLLFQPSPPTPYAYCHRPIIVTDPTTRLGKIVNRFYVNKESHEDDVIDQDIVVVWAHEKRIITGADILGRLLRGIAKTRPSS
ncbi:MAG: DUF21 domain-containing protein [Desulfatitalea sp.]|nr:DUF21 domain-containing protein [Desulfatitalea sp.]NNJ98945.1 DUF21 domain-containing protein [Desulfatitalea sp.]